MRPSKGNIVLDGQWLKDDEEVLLLPFTCRRGIVRRFSDATSAFCGFLRH